MSKSNIKSITIQNQSVIVYVCFVLFIVCLYTCVCECLSQNNNHKAKHKSNNSCGSAFELGASGLPYYCTSICVRSCCTWRASCVDSKQKQKTKKQSPSTNNPLRLGALATGGLVSNFPHPGSITQSNTRWVGLWDHPHDQYLPAHHLWACSFRFPLLARCSFRGRPARPAMLEVKRPISWYQDRAGYAPLRSQSCCRCAGDDDSLPSSACIAFWDWRT